MRTPYCINMCYAYNNKKELHNAVVILPFTFYICQVLLCLLYFNTEKGFRGCTNDVSYIYTFSSLSAIPKQICFRSEFSMLEIAVKISYLYLRFWSF